MRRLALAALALAVAMPTLAFAADGRPHYSLTSRDMRWAKAGLVAQRDVGPAFRPDPHRYANLLMPRCPGTYTPDRSDLTVTGRAESFFISAYEGAGSHVTILASAKQADTWWQRVVHAEIATCLGHLFVTHRHPGDKVELLAAGPLSLQHSWGFVISAYRIALRYNRHGRIETIYRDLYFVLARRAIGAVMVDGVGSPCSCGETLAVNVYAKLTLRDPHNR